MRGRYKAWAKPFLESHADFCVPRIEPADPFYDHRPLCLEIGIGKGDFILGYSELFPEGHYLGLERDVSIMGMAAKKVEEAGRTNIRLCAEDFDDLYEGLSQLSFDVIFLNFSDPWPQKRHEKRSPSARASRGSSPWFDKAANFASRRITTSFTLSPSSKSRAFLGRR